jgi:Flp pilus assembly secretin CpaC
MIEFKGSHFEREVKGAVANDGQIASSEAVLRSRGVRSRALLPRVSSSRQICDRTGAIPGTERSTRDPHRMLTQKSRQRRVDHRIVEFSADVVHALGESLPVAGVHLAGCKLVQSGAEVATNRGDPTQPKRRTVLHP